MYAKRERGIKSLVLKRGHPQKKKKEVKLTSPSPASVIQQPHAPFPNLLLLRLPIIILTTLIVIDPVDTKKVESRPDLLNQLVERLLVLGVIRGCLLAEVPLALGSIKSALLVRINLLEKLSVVVLPRRRTAVMVVMVVMVAVVVVAVIVSAGHVEIGVSSNGRVLFC